jgi:hypothetical protein
MAKRTTRKLVKQGGHSLGKTNLSRLKLKRVIPQIRKFIWCTTIDEFTCDSCLAMDGKVLTIQQVMTLKSTVHKYSKRKNMICRCYMMEI